VKRHEGFNIRNLQRRLGFADALKSSILLAILLQAPDPRSAGLVTTNGRLTACVGVARPEADIS
jgi:hypothetical protein